MPFDITGPSETVKEQILRAYRSDLAPGTVATEMSATSGATPVERWAPTAARYILSLGPSDSGASLALTQFYDPNYLNTWVIPPGLRVPPFRRS